MFIVISQKDGKYGVLDTSDSIVEFFDIKEIEQYKKSGVNIKGTAFDCLGNIVVKHIYDEYDIYSKLSTMYAKMNLLNNFNSFHIINEVDKYHSLVKSLRFPDNWRFSYYSDINMVHNNLVIILYNDFWISPTYTYIINESGIHLLDLFKLKISDNSIAKYTRGQITFDDNVIHIKSDSLYTLGVHYEFTFDYDGNLMDMFEHKPIKVVKVKNKVKED